ncbi:hypothetical protein [Brucella sp. IR073]|uniref:hypothetical protein n=1 Tax=unclassified Brucella TaxID=2632610 RepID=UPI003B9822E6
MQTLNRFEDVVDATRKMILAFRRHHMKPPAAILLSDKQDAFAIIHDMRLTSPEYVIDPSVMSASNVVEFDGKPCGTMEICGVKFYWPLQPLADKQGGYHYG